MAQAAARAAGWTGAASRSQACRASTSASGHAAEQLEDLGAVQEAVAAVEHELLLGVAPADERLRPRSASAEVEQLRAGVDHGAVGVTGGQG